jgi:hypothetical protein
MIEEQQLKFERADDEGEAETGPSSSLSAAARNRLTYLLIAKSIAEAAFVAVLALIFYFTAFPPSYRGWGEATADARIAGWAVNEAAPWDRVEVYLFIDGNFVARGVANLSRPDVSASGYAKDKWHGYVFDLPSLEKGEHEARVYAIHESAEGARRTLQLLGKPIPFRLEADATGSRRAVTNKD